MQETCRAKVWIFYEHFPHTKLLTDMKFQMSYVY